LSINNIYIGDELVYCEKSWSISSKLNSRSTLNITVSNKLNATISNGNSIEIIKGTDIIFSGIINSITKFEPIPYYIYYQLNCVDNSALADKRIIADFAENEKCEDIITNKILPILAEEGVTAGNIECELVIKKAIFNYIKVSDALNQLSDLTSYIWYIDETKKLNFFERSTYIAPFELSASIPHYNFNQTNDMKTYRNRQFVRGSRCKTDEQSLEKPSPTPDGKVKSYIVRYPIAKKPRIFINNVEVSTDDIGVNGLDQGKKWYFTFDSNIVSQDSAQTALLATDIIAITYTGLRNLFVVIDNSVEMSNRAIIETGTSGIYEKLTEESFLDEKLQAIDYGNSLLVKYGEIEDKISFVTEQVGLKVGQLLIIDKPLFNINSSTFLIEDISISPIDSEYLEYSVSCLDGASIGGWEQFFKKILDGNKKFTISENEVLIRLVNLNEQNNSSCTLDIQLFNSLFPAEDLYPADNLYPGTLIDTINLFD